MALLESFNIWLDQPSSKSYTPGETLTGRVVTKSYFEKNVKGLKLTFNGRAIVKWNEEKVEYQEDARNNRQVAIPISKSVNDACNYFQFNRYLLGDGETNVRLPSGENSYEFSFTIPPINLPASYKSNFCTVEYLLEAKFKSCGLFDQYKAQKWVNVVPVVDLNDNLTAVTPGEWEIFKNYSILCCKGGTVTIDVRTPCQGFIAGESIPLQLEIDNMSHKRVKDVVVDLIQEDTYLAEGKVQIHRRELFKARRGQPIGPITVDTWQLPVHIPDSVPPTNLGNCQIIKVQYFLEITANVSRAFTNLFKSIPVIIGTIPVGRPGPDEFSVDSGIGAGAPPPPYFSVFAGTSNPHGDGSTTMYKNDGYNECYTSTTKLIEVN